MLELVLASADHASITDRIKGFIDALCAPQYYVPLSCLVMIVGLVTYKTWTKPKFAIALLIAFTAFYSISCVDEDFRKIIKKPDNVPITMMIYLTGFCTWLGMRQAAQNDERMKRGEPLLESGADDKVLVWPDLV